VTESLLTSHSQTCGETHFNSRSNLLSVRTERTSS